MKNFPTDFFLILLYFFNTDIDLQVWPRRILQACISLMGQAK